jgi:glutathione-regulated potassium-efflux system ancillary protein KefG
MGATGTSPHPVLNSKPFATETPVMNKILIIFAHPAIQKSRIHRKLCEAARAVEGVTFHDLYSMFPDFYIPVKREQKRLEEHDIIIFQHPLYWYSCPALLKEWMDLVLEHNFAFGKVGVRLKGKKLISVISTGGSFKVYQESGSRHFTIPQILAPFHQTANLCGMEYLPPFVVHGSHLLTKSDIADYHSQYMKVLTGLRDDAFPQERMASVTYLNEMI